MIDSQLATLLHWIGEREAIRLKKEAGAAPPWTDDKILGAWRFCNVNRCDDRETRWIFEHLIAAHADNEALWFNLAIARFINWHPTLERLGYFHAWDAARFCACLSALPGKAYTGAYMIPAGKGGVPKHAFLASEVFTPLWQLRAEIPREKRCDQWDGFLRRVACMGDFLRNQIITDLKHTRYLQGAADWTTFVLAGPGTQRGLNRLHGKPLAAGWRQQEANAALQALRAEVVGQGSQHGFSREQLERAHQFCHNKALVDIISMVKHAVDQDQPLLTAAERVAQAMTRVRKGQRFTPQQEKWLDRIRLVMVQNLSIDEEDFADQSILQDLGGLGAARRHFGRDKLEKLLHHLNEAIAA